MGDALARLRGGPEDGREVRLETDTAGRPVPRVMLPFHRPANAPIATELPGIIYERSGVLPDGAWLFRYVGVDID